MVPTLTDSQAIDQFQISISISLLKSDKRFDTSVGARRVNQIFIVQIFLN